MAAEAAGVEASLLREEEGAGQGRAFKDRFISNFFDGADKFAIIKAMAPMEVFLGVGALTAVFLPKVWAGTLAALLLVPPIARVALRSVGVLRNPHMDRVVPGRVTAKLEGDFCVLLIGARNNAPWKLTKKFNEIGTAFGNMFRELESLPIESTGYLGAEQYSSSNWQRSSHVMAVMYWRSYDHLLKFAHSPSMKHLAAWQASEKETKASSDIALWHEAYPVRDGKYDAIYVNCPPLGLAMAGELQPCTGRLRTSRGRSGC